MDKILKNIQKKYGNFEKSARLKQVILALGHLLPISVAAAPKMVAIESSVYCSLPDSGYRL